MATARKCAARGTLSLPVSPLTCATADTLHSDDGVPDVVMTLSRTPAVGGVSAASVEVFASLNVYVITALAVTVISVLGVMTVTLAESRSPESDAKFTVTWCVVPASAVPDPSNVIEKSSDGAVTAHWYLQFSPESRSVGLTESRRRGV